MSDVPLPVSPVVSAVCGRCGYSAIGLTSLTCPECGGDLRLVGIITPNNPDRAGIYFLVQAVLFTCVYIVTAIALTDAMLRRLIPQPLEYARQVQLIQPASARYQSVELSMRIRGLPELGVKDPVVRLELAPVGASAASSTPPPAALSIDVAADPSIASTSVVLNWMKTAGVDVTDPKVQSEARTIAAAARVLGQPQPKTSNGYMGSSSSGSAPMGSGFGSVTRREATDALYPGIVASSFGIVVFAVWVGGLMLMRSRSAADKH